MATVLLSKPNNTENVRIETKRHSGWPTIPQLFVNGELIGGADIANELHQSGQLLDILDKANS